MRYTTDDGEAGAALAERRRERAAAASARAAVRLLLPDAPGAARALRAWARRRAYELVPLRERADPAGDPGPFPETYGAERARAALHAHAWRGLRRLDRPERPAPHRTAPPAHGREPTSSDDDYEGLAASDDEAAVERAEAFVEALGALGDARAVPELAPDERRRRAERLVAAFCRALGADLPAL
ncbi:uncharacterized protein LOC123655310 [Melitaea cinxia]|uniref:uncharacterized protein LOC123655310 n=1 Tax=Melitaea cinxia TaxID=113334 RepID=UPI001E273660|nr:uncharacterized protein LOC123655310 [Melitaea cinxia]